MNTKPDIEAINQILSAPNDNTFTDSQLGLRAASGIPTSENQKKAVSKANAVSRSRAPWTDERKAAASAKHAMRMNERNAMRAAGILVQVISNEGRKNIGQAAEGRKASPESLKKRSESMKRTLALKRGIVAK